MDVARFAGFVAQAWPGARRVVEVAAGGATDVAEAVRGHLPEAILMATSSDPACVTRWNERGIPAIRDDLERPQYGLYTGADLLYAARLPAGLAGPFADLADAVHCDALLGMEGPDPSPGAGWQRVVDQGVTLAWVRPAARLGRPRPPRPTAPPPGAPPPG